MHQSGLGRGWFEWAYSLALEQDYPSCGSHPPECWHSGMVEDKHRQHKHQKYCFNRSSAFKEDLRKEKEQFVHKQLKAEGTGGAWGPLGLRSQGSSAEPALIPPQVPDLHWSIRSWSASTDLHITHYDCELFPWEVKLFWNHCCMCEGCVYAVYLCVWIKKKKKKENLNLIIIHTMISITTAAVVSW